MSIARTCIVLIFLLTFTHLSFAAPSVSFISPTPPDEDSQDEINVEINVSITEANLDEVVYNWDGTNYTLHGDSLVLMMNLDNIASIGENATKSVDVSGYGNNGTFYGMGESGYSKINTSSATKTASGTYSSYVPDNAFDGDLGTWWWSPNAATGHWLKIDFGSDSEKTVTKIRLYHDDAESIGAVLQASNDDSSWTNLTYFTHPTELEWYNETFENTDPYRYYRILILNGTPSINWLRVEEWELYQGGIDTLYSSGKYDQGLSLNESDQYVDCGNDASLQITGDISIEAWIKPAQASDGDFDYIATKLVHSSSKEGYALGLWSDNTVAFMVGRSWSNWNLALSDQVLSAGEWYHVAGVYDGTNIKVYINGVERGSQPYSSGIVDSATPLLIGKRSDGNPFNGEIDEVYVWSRSLTPSDVYQHYASNLRKTDTDQWYLYVNQSKNATAGLDNGTYTYQVSATDESAGTGSDGPREITIGTPTPAGDTGPCYDDLYDDARALSNYEESYYAENGEYTCDKGLLGWMPTHTGLDEWNCEYADRSDFKWNYTNGTSSANSTNIGIFVTAPPCETPDMALGCLKFSSDLQGLKNAEELYYNENMVYTCDLTGYWTPANTSPSQWTCLSADGSGYEWEFVSGVGETITFDESYTADCTDKLRCYFSEFTGDETTDIDSIVYTYAFDDLVLENDDFGKISWSGSYNISGINLSELVEISDNYVYVDADTVSNLDGPANVILYDLPWQEIPVLYRNGAVCTTGCSFVSYASNDYTFSVTGFSNYTTGANSRLEVYDDNDPEGGSQGKTQGSDVTFYANYSNITSGVPITNAIGQCNITFNEAPAGPFAMTYNSTTKLWEYNRTLNNALVDWSVSCSGTDYEPLTTTDDITLYSTDTVGSMAYLYGANITNATDLARWIGNISTVNDTTEGGNITIANLNGSSLTDRWAGYFGNVSGDILLTDNASGTAAYLYSWSWNSSFGGVVCASTNSFINRVNITGASGADIDIAWGFGAVADSGANTFNGSNCSLAFDSTYISNASYADTGPAGGFVTCAYKSTSTPAKNQMFFCSNITYDGLLYNGGKGDFELIVPTAYGIGVTETYYFYVNLN